MRTFTLEEAQALLPVLESLLKRVIDAKLTAETVDGELQELNRKIYLMGGMQVDVPWVSRKRAERDKQVQIAKDTLAEIDAIGVQVKDLDTGLLDFPCRVDGEVVLLCWKMGEQSIGFWHTMEDGFRGRQPLDARFGRLKGEKPN